jgi:HEAT repeat protein
MRNRVPKPMERYNRTAKGSNMAEWQRRLSDPQVHVRLEALQSIGEEGGEESVKPLLQAMADSDRRVRVKAIDLLGQVGDPAATEVLVQALFLNNVEHSIKERILAALGRIRDPASVERLLDFSSQTDDSRLLCMCIFALGEIADPKTRGPIRSLKEAWDDADVDRLADDALAKIDARIAAAPTQQPSILELEKRLGPRRP